jgi:uncharacterized repeat protein (TIGR01451 family)
MDVLCRFRPPAHAVRVSLSANSQGTLSMIRRFVPAGLMLAVILLAGATSSFATITSNGLGGGAWNSTGTWIGGVVPTGTDDVAIQPLDTVTITTTQLANNVTVNGTGTLTVSGGTLTAGGTIGFNPGIGGTGTVNAGNGTINTATLAVDSGSLGQTSLVTIGTGLLNVSGSISFSGLSAANSIIRFTGNGTLRVGASLGSNGTLDPQTTSGAVRFAGLSPQTIPAYTYGALSTQNSSGVTLGGAVTVNKQLDVFAGTMKDGGFQIAGTASTLVNVSAGATLDLAATFPTSVPPGNVSLAATSTVKYSGTGAQTIATGFSYGNLSLTTTGTIGSPKGPSGTPLQVGGNLDVSNGGIYPVSLSMGGADLFVAGNYTGTGSLVFTTGTFSLTGDWTNVGNFTPGTGTLSLNGSGAHTLPALAVYNLTVSGTAVYSLSGATTVAGDLSVLSTLDVNSLTLSVTKSMSIIGAVTGAGVVTIDGSSGNVSGSGTFAPTLALTASKTFNTSGLTFSGTISLATGVTLTNTGTLVVNNVTGTDATSTLTNASGGALSAGGTLLATGTLNAGASPNLVTYGGATQTIKFATSYHNLTLSNSSIATIPGGMTINGLFTVGSTSVATLGGAENFAGGVSVGASASLTLGTFVHTVGGNWSSTGTATVIHSNSTINFNGGSPQTIANAAVSSFGNVSFSGAGAKSFGASMYVLGDFAVNAGATVNAGSSAIWVGGDWTRSGTFNGGTSAVTFTGAAQNIDGTSFYDLAFSGSSNKAAFGSFTVARNVTIGISTTFILGAFAHSVGGDWINNGSFTATGSTLNFNGAGAQSVTGGSSPFNAVNFTGGGMKSVDSQVLIDGDVSIAAGATLYGGSGGWLLRVGGNWNNGGTFNAGNGLVELASTAATQTITATSFNDVTFSNPGTKKALGNLNAAGNLLVNTGAIFDANGFTHGVGGNWTDNGSFTSTGSTVNFVGTGAQTIGAETFNNVFVAKTSGAATLGGTLLVTGNFQVSLGQFNAGAAAMQVNGNFTNLGTVDAGTNNVTLKGNVTNHGSFAGNLSTVVLSGSAQQTVSGVTAMNLFNLSVVNTGAGIALQQDLSLNGTLGLTTGVVTITSGKSLFVASSGNVSRVGGFVDGKLAIAFSGPSTKTFDVGTTLGYAPVSVATSSAGTVAITAVGSPQPNNLSANANLLQMYWTIGTSAVTGMNLTFTYPVAAVNGTEGSYVLGRYNAGWTRPGGTVNSGTHTATIAGVTAYAGDWTAGAPASLGTATTFVLSSTTSTTAGVGNQITIYAKDSSNNVDTGYNGDHTLTFAGAATSNGGNAPTVTDKSGTPIAFGSNTTLTFVAGVASNIQAAGEATLTLYHAQLANVTAAESGGPSTASSTMITVTPAAASALKFGTINSGSSPSASVAFPVTVGTFDPYGNASNVVGTTAVSLSTVNCGPCTGTLGGTTTASIGSGSNNTTFSGVTYSVAESNVKLTVTRTSGDILTAADSSVFTVLSPPTTYTVTSTADSGAGSLRTGITSANSGACGPNCTINFAIGGGQQTIALLSALPALTTPMTIDGTTQPGYSSTPVIQLNGASAGAGVNGLHLTGGSTTIKALVISQFTSDGILIDTNGGNNIQGNYIGTDFSGGSPLGNSGAGVEINGTAGNNIGGITAGFGNLISGNTGGILISGGALANANLIQGNLIGTNATGTAAVANGKGIFINGAQNNTVGGTSVAARNVISGNTFEGIKVSGALASGTQITGNYIGVQSDGTSALANQNGIRVDTAATALAIGGTVANSGNTIARNSQAGVVITGTTTKGIRILGNSMFNNNIGIDLLGDGITFNDSDDSDTGFPNNLQNYPTIGEAYLNGTTLQFNLSVDSSGASPATLGLRVQLFKADTSLKAQGKGLLFDQCIAGNVLAGQTFTVPAAPVVAGDKLVATATSYNDNVCSNAAVNDGTSEFSAAATTIVTPGTLTSIASGFWTSASTWDAGRAPGSLDSVIVNHNVNLDVPAGVTALTVAATLDTQTFALTVPTINLSGVITGSGTVTAGTLNWSGGSLFGGGSTVVNSALNISGGGKSLQLRTLTNNGAGSWTGGNISMSQSTFTNSAGATLTISSTNSISGDASNPTFVNAGTVTKSSPGTTGFPILTNTGTINVNAGILSIASSFGSSSSPINVAGGANVEFTGSGTGFTLGTASTLTGAGSVTVSGATVNANGTWNITGGTTVAGGGTLTFSNSATVTDTGLFTVSSGRANFNKTGGVDIDDVILSGGTIAGSGPLDVTNSLSWSSGTLGGGAPNGGTLTIYSPATLSITTSGPHAIQLYTLQNDGAATWTGSSDLSFSQATINNTGTFTIQNDQSFLGDASNPAINNSGIFRKNTAAGITTLSSTVFNNNGGTLDIQTGQLNFGGAFSTTGTSSFTGAGRAKLMNSASLGGTLTLGSAFTLETAGGTITAGNGTSVSGAGTLDVNGAAVSVNGTGNLNVANVLLRSGSLGGSGTLGATLAFNWTGGTLGSGGGTFTASGATTSTISGNGGQALDGFTFANNGTLHWDATAGALLANNGAVINNVGTFIAENDQPLSHSTGAATNFNSSGTLRKMTAVGTSLFDVILNLSAFSGIDLPSGIISVTGGFNATGNPSITNGKFRVAGGSGNIGSAFTIGTGATLDINAGSINFGSGLLSGAGTLSISGGAFNVNSPGATSIANVNLGGGFLGGSGAQQVNSQLTWAGGTLGTGGGSLTIAAAATGTITNSGLVLDNFTLTNNGNTLWDASGGAITVNNGSAINNFNNTFEVKNDSAILHTAGVRGMFNNGGGTLVKDTATGNSTWDVTLNNSSIIDLQSGILSLFAFSSGGSPTLKLHLGGVTPGTQFSRLNAGNNPTFTGTLHVLLNGMYVPQGGDQFLVVPFAGVRSGDFTTYTLAPLPGGKALTNSYVAGGLQLDVTGGGGDLGVTMSDNPDPVVENNQLTYTVNLTNAGPDPSTSISVTDNIPAGTTFVSAGGPGGWNCSGTTTITCTLATLAVGSAPPITIVVTAPPGASTIANTVNVTSTLDPNGANNSANTTTVICATPSNAISGATNACANSSGNTATVPLVSGVTYLWTITNGTITSGTNGNSVTYTAGSAGQVQLDVAVSTACQTINGTAFVTINPLPSSTISAPSSVCALATGVPASVPFTAGASYSWSISAGTIASGAGTNSITFDANTAGPIVLNVTVSDSNGCSSSSSTMIAVNLPPAASVTAPATACPGATGLVASVPFTAGATYNWTATNATITSGAGTSAIAFTAGSSGSSVLAVTVTSNGCSASGSATVSITPPPNANITAPATVCANAMANAGVPFQTGASYSWTISGGTFTSVNSTANVAFTAGASGNVVLGVSVTGGGCSSTSSVTLPISALPTSTPSNGGPYCAGQTIQLSSPLVSATATYLWSGPNGFSSTAQSPSIANATTADAGTYTLTVTDNGCSSAMVSGNTTVVVNAAPNASISAPGSVPANSTGNTASVANAGMGATYLWTISNGTITAGASTNSITWTASSGGTATINVTVTNGGCSASGAIAVSISGGASATDLAVSIDATPNPVAPGAPISFNITVTNNGPSTATSLSLSDALPAGFTLNSAGGAGWLCPPAGNIVDCSMATLASGSTASLTIAATAPSVPGTATNSVNLFAPVSDPLLSNNTASVLVTIGSPSTANCNNAPPSLIQPAPGAVNVQSPVSFSWSAVANATQYTLWISVNGDAPANVATTAGTSASASVPSGVISWYVEAQFANCPSAVSATRTFTVTQRQTCGTAVATLLAPAEGSTLAAGDVSFAWSPVAGAVRYRLWLAVDSPAFEDVGVTTATALTFALRQGGSVAWFVEAIFDGCPSTKSANANFKIPPQDPCAGHVAPSLLAPAANATGLGSPVTYGWTASPGASNYRLWSYANGSTPQPVATTTQTRFTIAVNSGPVEWFVEALFDGCAAVESQHGHLTVRAGEECNSQKPSTLSPANGATLTSTSVTFAWSAVPQANAYEVWASFNGNSPILLGGTTGALTLTKTVGAGSLQWYVRALFDGCPTTESARSAFTITLPADCDRRRPILLSPADQSPLVPAPVDFSWSGDPSATGYKLFVAVNGGAYAELTSSTSTSLSRVDIPAGTIDWFIEETFTGCPPVQSATSRFTVPASMPPCGTPQTPVLSAGGEVSSGVQYTVRWSAVPNAGGYELQESAAADFAHPSIQTLAGTSTSFRHDNMTGGQLFFYYRVRAVSRCNSSRSAYSEPVAVTVEPLRQPDPSHVDGAAPGENPQSSTYQLVIGGSSGKGALQTLPAGTPFSATTDQPWLKVTPSSGTIQPGGTVLTVNADAGTLPLGASIGNVSITTGSSQTAGRAQVNGTTSVAVPVTISLVTPVTPTSKSTPPPDALIIPAVAHADSVSATFESDVRLTNTAPIVAKYQLSFTPSGDDGIKAGKQTTVQVDPGQTIALNDILKAWYGVSAPGETAAGVLELRSLNAPVAAAVSSVANTLYTFASSRTYAVTSAGTFGQFIPAMQFKKFVGSSLDNSTVLSLQQVAQSADYRTNLGLVEGSGQAASLLLSVFASSGAKLGEFPVNLGAGQHVQMNSFLAGKGITLPDGRIEVKVTSSGGKVTAYASVLDNKTNDPLLVNAVQTSTINASRYVVPGVADLSNGVQNWRTDMRIFNAGTSMMKTTLTFYPQQNPGGATSTEVMVAPGEVRVLDNLLASTFGITGLGGAVHVSTEGPSKLVTTARTYNLTSNGTFGQFIPAVTADDAVGVGGRPLQLLQIEDSDRFRSNIGLAEVTGKPAKVELSVVTSESKVTPVIVVDLAANEFRQIPSLIRSLNLTTYNGRIAVRVVEGAGKITAYGSVIDNATGDPTYVPAQ